MNASISEPRHTDKMHFPERLRLFIKIEHVYIGFAE